MNDSVLALTVRGGGLGNRERCAAGPIHSNTCSAASQLIINSSASMCPKRTKNPLDETEGSSTLKERRGRGK
jgi:hypothetical protein